VASSLRLILTSLCHAVLCCAVLCLQVRRNAHVEIVPLSTGCLGSCTYCKTKHARGQLGSYLPEAIVARVTAAAADPLVRQGRRGGGMEVCVCVGG
jgi:hypothetical protein